MCSRYYADDGIVREMEKLFQRRGQEVEQGEISGDIRPGDRAAVLAGDCGRIGWVLQRWGFTGFQGGGLIFNAKSETALEKKMFRESLLRRRCVVPAAWFYEWDRSKNKIAFFRRDRPTLFMAGIYSRFSGEDRFVVLTVKANASVEKVHGRMPLILEREEIEDWILSTEKAEGLLHKDSCALEQKSEYEQQRLPFL